MNKSIVILSFLVTATGAVLAQDAGTATRRVDRREAHQQQRIDQGVASGQLTPKETARLQTEQGRIQTTEARAKSDGVVTSKERAHLNHLQNKASHDIHRAKHNQQHV